MEQNISKWILMFVNDTDIYYDNEYTNSGFVEERKSVMYVTLGMLGFLSLAGIIGNILVLYVFTRQKQKLSSTIFILTLAGTDLISSLVTMPFTIAMELLHFHVNIDAVCKIYHLLATTAISFSAAVMVAIAVDRYLCIVHPFKQTMTIKRAKITVVFLAIFSTCMGLPSSLMYGVNVTYARQMTSIPDYLENATTQYSILNDTKNANELNMVQVQLLLNETDTMVRTFTINTGTCHKNELILGNSFFGIYQKIYSSYFAICAVIVMALYFIIYRSVLIRRRNRFNLTTNCCGILMPRRNVNNNEHAPDLILKERHRSLNDSSNETLHEELVNDHPKQGSKNEVIAEKRDCNARRESLVRRTGITKAHLENLRMANIKNALLLSIVALTYMIAFMPAWLMALHIIPMNTIVFYMYFTYNVANPIIYAFLNESFRNCMQELFQCRQLQGL